MITINIDKVRQNIIKLNGKRVLVKINVGRNKYEYLEGEIKEIYPRIFVVKSDNALKSFSYSDLLIKNITIKEI